MIWLVYEHNTHHARSTPRKAEATEATVRLPNNQERTTIAEMSHTHPLLHWHARAHMTLVIRFLERV